MWWWLLGWGSNVFFVICVLSSGLFFGIRLVVGDVLRLVICVCL